VGETSKPEPAAQRAYAYTRELILRAELPGGHLFSEGEIAERLGISRTPVREAFQRLSSEGLLELYPKRGAVVVPLTPGEARDVLDVREALERSAVRRLLTGDVALDDLVAQLEENLGVQRARAEAGDAVGFAQVDQEFHELVVTASGNAVAARYYRDLRDRQRRMGVHALRPSPGHLHRLVDEHAELLGHITERDEPAFTAALRRHMDETHRTLLGGFENGSTE
jgi:DNA-binding GntR family transcriptional regulator